MNFNTIRIFAAWDRIEREEGEFDFSKQDHALKLAEQHGLKVIVNIGGVFANLCGIYPPSYLLRNYQCQPTQNASSVPAHNVAPSRGICLDTPIYRKKAFEFMQRAVAHFAKSDAVIAWMIWNEPAAYPCYCTHTLSRFQEWLRDKYEGDLGELNRLWSTEHPIDYRDWSEVQAPHGKGVFTIWRDWMQFNQFRLYGSMGQIHEMVQQYDPKQRPTTSNLVHHMAGMEGPVNAPQYGLDLGRVGQNMSIMGASFYTVEHKYDVGTGALSAYNLSRLRSASIDSQRRVLVLESGGGGPNRRGLTQAQHMVNLHQLFDRSTVAGVGSIPAIVGADARAHECRVGGEISGVCR